ncbi:hypothetical protein SAAV_c18 (plasmid) [Staphylococcus aureus subsp. aureus ED98]|uniref:Uncharacterized protein n=1 Tax=Staphylococcus aureus TaxID=1280 RepID=A0A4P8DKM2_STAAU|nr:hypothetical protein SAAV_c18 [Staphylococcus aureus subsp. aureus ED98]AYK27785.1 hypothetical protein BJL72_k00010 [Staphylococcus aureus]AYK27900.1 hypothetical protein D0Y75_a00120 [Staphylococcus aureus]AYK27978.1 hypothetical protein D0Y79_a00125 [Staphylococcus aureus]AYK28003.1 hypothetical protein D0Y81_a00120 [Staphylococcus aureus]
MTFIGNVVILVPFVLVAISENGNSSGEDNDFNRYGCMILKY